MKFVLKKSCQQLRIFRVAPFAHRLTSLGRTVLRHNRIDAICPEKIVPTAVHFSCRSFCAPLDKSWAHSFSAQSHWCNLSWKNRANSCAPFVSLLLRTAWQVLGAQYFGTIALMQFVLKNPCQQLCSFSLAPRQRSYACPIAQCLHTAWQVLGTQFFGTFALMEFVLKTPNRSTFSLYRSLLTELSVVNYLYDYTWL